jgi:hypothetical protein
MGELLFDGLANLVDASPPLLGNSKKMLSGIPAMRARLSSEPISDRRMHRVNQLLRNFSGLIEKG